MKLDPFSLYFIAFWLAIRLVRRSHLKVSRSTPVIVDRSKGIELLLLAGTTLSMALLPLIFVLTSLLDAFNYAPIRALQITGLVLSIPALWLLHRSHADLGRNWSISLQVREGHSLVTTGVYSRIRHPMYAGIWLWVFTQALMLPNWVVGVSPMVAFGMMYMTRVHKEEALMRDHFGPEFDAYARRTGRIIPRVT